MALLFLELILAYWKQTSIPGVELSETGSVRKNGVPITLQNNGSGVMIVRITHEGKRYCRAFKALMAETFFPSQDPECAYWTHPKLRGVQSMAFYKSRSEARYQHAVSAIPEKIIKFTNLGIDNIRATKYKGKLIAYFVHPRFGKHTVGSAPTIEELDEIIDEYRNGGPQYWRLYDSLTAAGHKVKAKFDRADMRFAAQQMTWLRRIIRQFKQSKAGVVYQRYSILLRFPGGDDRIEISRTNYQEIEELGLDLVNMGASYHKLYAMAKSKYPNITPNDFQYAVYRTGMRRPKTEVII